MSQLLRCKAETHAGEIHFHCRDPHSLTHAHSDWDNMIYQVTSQSHLWDVEDNWRTQRKNIDMGRLCKPHTDHGSSWKLIFFINITMKQYWTKQHYWKNCCTSILKEIQQRKVVINRSEELVWLLAWAIGYCRKYVQVVEKSLLKIFQSTYCIMQRNFSYAMQLKLGLENQMIAPVMPLLSCRLQVSHLYNEEGTLDHPHVLSQPWNPIFEGWHLIYELNEYGELILGLVLKILVSSLFRTLVSWAF